MLNAMFKKTVIDGLECCTNRPKTCGECPYQGYNPPDGGNYPDCKELLMINALSKIKYLDEQFGRGKLISGERGET